MESPLCPVSGCGRLFHLAHCRVWLYCQPGVMFTMRLDPSLCGMWHCEAPVLLVGVVFFILQCRVLALPRAYCVICTMYAAACSIRD